MTSPLITTASIGNPGYLEANISSTIPVPLLMIMAPKRGVQPCHIKSLTTLLPRTMTAHVTAEHMSSMARMRGNTVLTQLMRMEHMVPRKESVTRSPRKDATGGAILSKNVWSDREEKGRQWYEPGSRP